MKHPSREGKFSLVIDGFLDHIENAGELADATISNWKRELLLAQESLGDWTVEQIRPSLVQRFLDKLSQWPAKQRHARTALKALEKWAVVRDYLPYPICTGTTVSGKLGGHQPWTDAQVELAEKYASPFMSRAVTLAANTGQRGSDLIRMGWSDIESYNGRLGINVIQKKTKRRLWVPLTIDLERALETWEKRPGPFLTTRRGASFTSLSRAALSARWTYERDTRELLEPLVGLTLHGLRATAVVRLRQAGAELTQIADCIGMSERMVRHYCRLSDQQANAFAAVLNLDRIKLEREEKVRNSLKSKTTKSE